MNCAFVGSVWYSDCGVRMPMTPMCTCLPCAHAVKRGDRIAQLILERIVTPEVEEVEDLDATDRGAGGFGSTGVAAQ